MKKALVLIIMISMLCAGISGAAVSINEKIELGENEFYPINEATQSPEVNTKLLNNINQVVDKYMNMDETIYNTPSSPEEFVYPWSERPLPKGDFVQWVIRVNYNGKHFEKVIDISPVDFKDRFLNHPLHYEFTFFDVNEDGTDDLKVFYSIFTSQIYNKEYNDGEGIKVPSIESMIKIRADDIEDRTALLEVWSEIRLNWGLIPNARSNERSTLFNGRFTNALVKILERIQGRLENTRFTIMKNFIDRILNRLQKNDEEQDIGVLANDDDHILLGIGIGSPEGKTIPIEYEKRFAVGKKNIFSPRIFEHELRQTQSREPLELLFGFQAFTAGSSTPTYDISFNMEFDPAIYVRTNFIPREGYIYYFFDYASGYSKKTIVNFTANIIKGVGEEIVLSLIFDSTSPLAQSGNWISFDLDLFDFDQQEIWGFHYDANKIYNIGIMVSSPVFSGKIKYNGIPTSVDLGFKVDVDITVQQGLFEALGEAWLYLDMSGDLNDITIYYPKLSSEEPDIEFVKFSDIPREQTLTAHTDLYIENSSMLTIEGNGWLNLDMSTQLGAIEVFYPKADPEDPSEIMIEIPSGVPRTQRVGAKAKLYMNPNDFYDPANLVYGRAYRTSSGNILKISGFLPGADKPIIEFTEIPSNSEVKGELEWNKLKGYGYAERSSATNPDPIAVDIDIGTFNLYNYLEIQDGHIRGDIHLQETGYFGFDTANDMFNDDFRITDTSTGNQLEITVNKVNANDLWADWVLDFNEQPVQVEELYFGGELSLLDEFEITATYQGKYLNFETDWHVGEEGEFTVEFSQDEPIVLEIDDLFPDNPTWDVRGGVTLSQDFHFDIKWDWIEGEELGDRGEFKINEDATDPNIDVVFFNITYTPDGYDDPQYGIEAGATDLQVVIYIEWWKGSNPIIPNIWWYASVGGDFYLDLLWKGTWHMDVHLWPW